MEEQLGDRAHARSSAEPGLESGEGHWVSENVMLCVCVLRVSRWSSHSVSLLLRQAALYNAQVAFLEAAENMLGENALDTNIAISAGRQLRDGVLM